MNYNKLNVLITGLFFLFIVIACGKDKPTEPVAIKDFCKAENAGGGAMIEGYVWTNDSVKCKKTSTFMKRCSLEMYDNPEHKGDFVNVTFKEGSGNAEMAKLPTPFNQNNIKIKTNTGEEVGVRDKIRIIGHATINGKESRRKFAGCYINALEIEKVN